MKNLCLLIKMQLRQILNAFKEKKNKSSAGVTYLILGGLFIFISFYYNYEIHRVLKLINELPKYIGVSSSVALVLIMVTSITKVKGSFYGNKDYNLLKTMPIKNSSIIAYKIISIYATELAFALLFITPNLVFTIYYGEITKYYVFAAISAIIFIPLLPILFFGILGLFLSLVFDRFKYSSIITSILMIGFIVAIYLLIYIPSDNQMGNMYISLYNGLSKADPLLKILKDASDGSLNSLLIFIGFNVLFAIFAIILFTATYNKINMKIDSRTYKKSKNIEFKSSSTSKALFKTELRRISTSHNVLINVLIGPIMSVLVVVIMYFSLNGDKEVINSVKNILPITAILIIGMCPYSAFSISIEGETFWILKVMPVSSQQIFKNKKIISYIFTLPFSVAAAVVAYFMFKFNLIILALLIVIFILADIIAVNFGLYQNLKKGQIHYKNELESIKKGASTLVMMGYSSILYIIFMLLLVLTSIFLSIYLGYAAIILIEIVILYLVMRKLNKNGQMLFDIIY